MIELCCEYLICTMHLTVSYDYAAYVFQSESRECRFTLKCVRYMIITLSNELYR